MEWAVIVLIFFAVIAISALLFGGWLVFAILRLVVRGVAACFGPVGQSNPRATPTLNQQSTNGPYLRCTQEKCRHGNPTGACFCRRCGTALATPQRVMVSRAAML